MRCPWCPDVAGGHRTLLAHLAEHHPDSVVLSVDHEGKVFYEMHCPLCSERHRQLIRKGGDAEFLARQDSTIRMVALDMLVTHLMAEHDGEPDVEPDVDTDTAQEA